MININKKIFFVIALSALIFPMVTSAAGLIPCGTTSNPNPCTLCHFIIGFKNLIDYGFTIVTIAAIAAIFIAGTMYIISSGNEGMMTSAKGFIKASLIGFAVVFGGWLIVNVTMQALSAKSDLGISAMSWNNFECDATSRANLGGVVPVPQTSQAPVVSMDAINDRRACLVSCAQFYQVNTVPFLNCWNMKCPAVPFIALTSDDSCFLGCSTTFSGYNDKMYNCMKLNCPSSAYVDDYKPENFVTETRCGKDDKGLCHPNAGVSRLLASCPAGYEHLSGGADCPARYRCCIKK